MGVAPFSTVTEPVLLGIEPLTVCPAVYVTVAQRGVVNGHGEVKMRLSIEGWVTVMSAVHLIASRLSLHEYK